MNQDGYTPLLWASSCGHDEITKILIDHGALIEATDKVREIRTYLNRKMHVLDFLILFRMEILHYCWLAKINIVKLRKYYYCAMHPLRQKTRQYAYRAIYERNDKKNSYKQCLYHFIVHNDNDGQINHIFIYIYIYYILSIQDGYTPLHWAARHGLIELGKLLIKNGAAIDVRDKVLYIFVCTIRKIVLAYLRYCHSL